MLSIEFSYNPTKIERVTQAKLKDPNFKPPQNKTFYDFYQESKRVLFETVALSTSDFTGYDPYGQKIKPYIKALKTNLDYLDCFIRAFGIPDPIKCKKRIQYSEVFTPRNESLDEQMTIILQAQRATIAKIAELTHHYEQYDSVKVLKEQRKIDKKLLQKQQFQERVIKNNENNLKKLAKPNVPLTKSPNFDDLKARAEAHKANVAAEKAHLRTLAEAQRPK